MLQSAKRHHPDAHLYCVIVDRDLSHAAALNAEFEVIAIDKLGLPLGEEFLFQYTILELNTAVKPWAIAYLLARGHDQVCYVDPDICFYKEMSEVTQLLSAGADIVLTPHLLAPVTDDKLPRELDIRRAGAYNFGFCALRDTANVRRFLRWWQSKLTRDCVNDADRGLFVDQGWIDLVPGLFDSVAILRHKGYNVAYWNIAQRPLGRRDSHGYFIDQEPLVFFHFSGLDPSDPASFSKHQTRFTLATVGVAKELVGEYVSAVVANGYRTYAKLEYGFECFSSGEKIPNIFRNLYRLSSGLRERMGPRPFTRASAMCELWPEIAIDGISPTNAMMSLWNVRHDVQSEFPMNSAGSVLGYYRWMVAFPPGAQHFPPAVIEYHAASVKRFEARAKEAAEMADAGQPTTWPGNEQRVHYLYTQLLNRNPDPGGLQIYSELCKTDAGFVRAWGEIGLSPESKKKRFLWFRMLKALLISIYKVDRRASEQAGAVEATKNVEMTITGAFPVEADVLTEGVWVTDRLMLPIKVRPGEMIRLEGIYFPQSIQKQTGISESKIRFLLGVEEIHAAQLSAHGNFTIECLIPGKYAGERVDLAIESSSVFVPKDIGPGDDARRLAWRMKVLAVGSERVFDCVNKDTYPKRDGYASGREAKPTFADPEPGKLAYTGFFQADPDSETSGVWASANIVVPIVPVEGEPIHLHGVYCAESIAKQTGSGDSTLRFFMGGVEIHSETLCEPGDFTVNFILPKLSREHGTSLHIQCSKSFVRKKIGDGDDDRILSWRIKKLTCGAISVLDCSRQNIATSNRRFVPRMTHTPVYSPSQVELFALYLPQFSPFPIDGTWRSANIASWAAVSNAVAQYPDHHQPQLPVEVGFYDYRSPGVMQRQVELARQYGFTGFCFHYFWSPGNAKAEQPLKKFLADPCMAFEFCVYWDHQKSVSDRDGDVHPKQLLPEDDIAFIDALLPAFADVRYRKVDQKPILIIANASVLPDVSGTVAQWRKLAEQRGLPGLYLIAALPVDTDHSVIACFDAQTDLSPYERSGESSDTAGKIQPLNPRFVGRIHDYGSITSKHDHSTNSSVTRFEAVIPSWDTEALKPEAGTSFPGASPENYARWLTQAVDSTAKKRSDEQLIFINAWNAWSEGAHMEPDQRHGYGYLHATATVLQNHEAPRNYSLVEAINRSFVKQHQTVVIAHVFYEDLIDSLFDSYLSATQHKCDLIVTVMQNASAASLQKIKAKFGNCFIIQTTNCGRDILPFVVALRKADALGYMYGCKLHTKKSLQRFDGNAWRTRLLDSLFPHATAVLEVTHLFETDPTLGLLAPAHSLDDLTETAAHAGNAPWLNKLLTRMGREEMIGSYNFHFPAGSMYWFRLAALAPLLDNDFVSLEEFEMEAGQLDGTLAHAIERITGLIPANNEYSIKSLNWSQESKQ